MTHLSFHDEMTMVIIFIIPTGGLELSGPLPVSFDGVCVISEARIPEDCRMTAQNWAPNGQEMDDADWLCVRDKCRSALT